MTDTTKLRPRFGAHHLMPDSLKAVYGGRWIATQDGAIDILWDRHGVEGDEADTAALLDWLNNSPDGKHGQGAIRKAREHASDLLERYVMRTREAHPFVLYQDDKGVVVGSTNASYGYLYVAAWLYDDLPDDDRTRGLDNFQINLERVLDGDS